METPGNQKEEYLLKLNELKEQLTNTQYIKQEIELSGIDWYEAYLLQKEKVDTFVENINSYIELGVLDEKDSRHIKKRYEALNDIVKNIKGALIDKGKKIVDESLKHRLCRLLDIFNNHYAK